ncbi:MAG: histidine phosphatase family protein [Oligoflexales bacterium]|nr:histidine phosphatase family protein [Oligoflexales bacterium]
MRQVYQKMHDLYLVRHAATQGNIRGAYVGRTDEGLSEAGISDLLRHIGLGRYAGVEHVYESPMRRCVETGRMIYGDTPSSVVEGFIECDFGVFDGKTYDELKDLPEYGQWLDSGGLGAAPLGESGFSARKRFCSAFERTVSEIFEKKIEKAALVIHGGTIMAVMERFSGTERGFFSWQARCSEGYHVRLCREMWMKDRKFAEIFEL